MTLATLLEGTALGEALTYQGIGDYRIRIGKIKRCRCGALVTTDWRVRFTTDPVHDTCGGCDLAKRLQRNSDLDGLDFVPSLAAEAGRQFAENLYGGYLSADAWKNGRSA